MTIEGFIDGLSDGVINGWVATKAEEPVFVCVYADGSKISQFEPSEVREDIVAIFGPGTHGFRFDFPAHLLPARAQDIELWAETSTNRFRLPMPENVSQGIAQLNVKSSSKALAEKIIGELRHVSLETLLGELSKADVFDVNEKAVLKHASNSFKGLHKVPYQEGCTPVHVAAGMRSADESISIGKDGWIFLEEGSNRIRSQYKLSPHDPVISRAIDSWYRVCQLREKKCKSVRYVQICIPEKSSIAGKYALPPFDGVTPILSQFESKIGSLNSYLSVYSDIIQSPNPEKWFYKTDTHLSNFGAFSLTQSIMKRLGFEVPEPVWTSKGRLHCGDVSRRLLGVPLFEEIPDPDSVEITAAKSSRSHIVIEKPPHGGHIGMRAELANPEAPFDKRLMVFGNSFFDIGVADYHLTWWLSLYFKNVKFIWTPEFNEAEVKSWQADIVICQTIERFLNQVPAT